MTLASHARAQTIEPREVAALSTVRPSSGVNETMVVEGLDRAMAVHHVLGAPIEIGYALGAPQSGGGWAWTQEGIIDPGAIGGLGLTDPSVAPDLVSGDFLVCAMTLDAPRRIVLSRYVRATGQFTAWQTLAEEPPPTSQFDKPWIVAGRMDLAQSPIAQREFYITFRGVDSTLRYLRSTNGGVDWVGGSHPLGQAFHPAPRVFGAGPLYTAYLGSDGYRVVRGDDAAGGQVQFTQLLQPAPNPNDPPVPLAVLPNLFPSGLAPLVAGPNSAGGNVNPTCPGFDLAVDPTNPDRLYLLYQDTVSPPFGDKGEILDEDVNLYLRVLTRQSGPVWNVGPRLLVADDDSPLFKSDQFMPTIDVDTSGRIHILYYDDRKFRPGQTDATFHAKFNVLYAWSFSEPIDFMSEGRFFELCDDPPGCVNSEPAVDYGVYLDLRLRDYIGLDAGPSRVVTTFFGTSATRDPDPSANKSLVWSSQIRW